MARSSVVALLVFGALAACGDRTADDAARVPTATEIASQEPAALVRRFEAVEERLSHRTFADGVGAERARAGHAALVAYRRHPDAGLARAARRLLGPAVADHAAGNVRCDAGRDLAELERTLGDDAAARTTVERVLADGVGSVVCRDAIRALASSMGVEVDRPTTSGAGQGSAHVSGVEVIAPPGAEAVASVRIVVSLDAAARGELAPASTFAGRRTARLRFDGASLAPSVHLPLEVGRGGLLRIEPAPRGEAGIDLVLGPTAVARAYLLEQPVRWIIDVVADPQATSARSEGPPRLIVLDPGHGGDEHGALVDGTRESHLVLDIAQRASAALRTLLPSTRVLLTRTTDDEVSLEQRSALANALDADLFVSIHLNDSDVPVQTGGITTFVLDTDDDTQAIRLAARENGTTTDRVGGLSVLLAGIERRSQSAESMQLASFVHADTLGHARRVLPAIPDRGVRSAMFYVLVGTRMPAILVEASFMTRPEELTALRTAVYRQQLGEGIATGIARYVASR